MASVCYPIRSTEEGLSRKSAVHRQHSGEALHSHAPRRPCWPAGQFRPGRAGYRTHTAQSWATGRTRRRVGRPDVHGAEVGDRMYTAREVGDPMYTAREVGDRTYAG